MIFVSKAGIFVIAYIVHLTYAIDPGPQNVNRTEGETDVLIDCTFSTNGAPIWRINDNLFDPFSLPTYIKPTIDGISVTRAERNLDQTRFQCFTPSGNGLQVSASNIGTLTVIAKSKSCACDFTKKYNVMQFNNR